MRSILRRLGAGVAIVALTAGATLLTSGVAQAQQAPPNLGTLTLTPATGTDLTILSARTSAGCNVPNATGYDIRVIGPNNFNYPMTTRGTFGFSSTDPFTVAFEQTMRDGAALNTPPTQIVPGDYTVTLNCNNSFGQSFGFFTGPVIRFTSPTEYVIASNDVATSTALAATPASPITAGTQTTLSATVTPSSATGTVEFFNGTTSLGAPVAVAGGTASGVTTLPVGTASLTARFTAGAGFQNSVSPAVSYQVNEPVGAPTTTTLSVTPGSPVLQGADVTLTSTVASASGAPAGSVQFRDGATALGSPVALTGGTATLTTNALPLGTRSLTASFVPADARVFAASSSAPPVLLRVDAPGQSSVDQNIQTEVQAGALVISVPTNPTVVLPSPVLVADASRLDTSGSINTVRVSDTRAGNPGWTASGQVTDFSDGGTGLINGANLGWSPQVVGAQTPFQVVTAGPVVNPAAAIAPGATAPAGAGIATARTLATAAAGFGTGTADLDADLLLYVPTTTRAGVYNATLTLTAI